jgi:hypothetical protein
VMLGWERSDRGGVSFGRSFEWWEVLIGSLENYVPRTDTAFR